MKAYYMEYQLDGWRYTAYIDAKDKASARHKAGRRHKLNAAQADKRIKITTLNVVGYL